MTVNKPTFTLARVVNESRSMKKLLDLGVDLARWERRGKVTCEVQVVYLCFIFYCMQHIFALPG